MIEPRNLVQRPHEFLPRPPLIGQRRAPLRRQPVESPPPLVGLLHPAPLHQPLPLQPVEHRINRRDVKLQKLAGFRFHQLRQLISMPLPPFEQRQQNHLRAAALQILGVHIRSRLYIYTLHIYGQLVKRLLTNRSSGVACIECLARPIPPTSTSSPRFLPTSSISRSPFDPSCSRKPPMPSSSSTTLTLRSPPVIPSPAALAIPSSTSPPSPAASISDSITALRSRTRSASSKAPARDSATSKSAKRPILRIPPSSVSCVWPSTKPSAPTAQTREPSPSSAPSSKIAAARANE